MKAMDPIGEAQLRRELASDLNGSFPGLVVAYQDRLYAFAYRVTGSSLDAEEIVQDALVRAYRALQGYSEERIMDLALKAWLYQITLNVCRNRLRSRKPPAVSLDQESDGQVIDPPDEEGRRPDMLFESAEQRRELATLVGALRARYRVPILLRYMEGLSYVELAAILDQPVGTAKSNVHRGIDQLRAAVAGRELARPVGVEE